MKLLRCSTINGGLENKKRGPPFFRMTRVVYKCVELGCSPSEGIGNSGAGNLPKFKAGFVLRSIIDRKGVIDIGDKPGGQVG